MVRRLLLTMLARAIRGSVSVLEVIATNMRTLVCIGGLTMLHVGLRGLEPWAPGLAWTVPGLIVTGVAIFGARGGATARRT